MAIRGDRVQYAGNQIVLPRPGGQGKALRLSSEPHPNIPVHFAVLGPKGLELAGEIADGWVGTCFVPEHSHLYLDPIRIGAARSGRSLSDIEILAGGPVAISDDVERLQAARRKALGFQISAMGSPTTNFYFDAYARMGHAEQISEVRRVWLSGDHETACRLVPQELVEGTSLYGTKDMVRERIRTYRRSGVTDLKLEPMGRTPDEKLALLGEIVDLVRHVSAE
jgi:alkanesulfonate monooxygenase SsuD/methylene tetrahydromethanopterin reductase-like flavin-dependent oxidoreductase (luciferase family)